ncbi:hypothetical protein ACG3SL_09100 [Sphingomonas sp. CJ20]
MATNSSYFLQLQAINGRKVLVNMANARAVSTIDMAGDQVGVVGFDRVHEAVVDETAASIAAALSASAATPDAGAPGATSAH